MCILSWHCIIFNVDFLAFTNLNSSPRDAKKEEESIVATTSGTAADIQYEEKKLEATADMCHYCFDIILQELQKRSNTDRYDHKFSEKHNDATNSLVPIDEILPTIDASCPLFVTWDKRIPNKRRLSPEHTEGQEYKHCYELRGCIGTLTSRPLITALREYAVLSAFRDSRFEPMRPNEVSLLRVAVSLLVCIHVL
jgi:AMMECR1 domain-containing protein